MRWACALGRRISQEQELRIRSLLESCAIGAPPLLPLVLALLMMCWCGGAQDPSNSDAFAFLGHYSLRVESDVAKATRCYLKALSVDAANREAGPVMADLYLCHDQSEEALRVCERATAANARADWAWIRLGRAYRAAGKPAKAVSRAPLSTYKHCYCRGCLCVDSLGWCCVCWRLSDR
jgi:tetratricopeptide (TPR) repeat protein